MGIENKTQNHHIDRVNRCLWLKTQGQLSPGWSALLTGKLYTFIRYTFTVCGCLELKEKKDGEGGIRNIPCCICV